MNKIIVLFLFISNLLLASNITPIPQYLEFDKDKAFLGKKLFSDKRLSVNKTISCESCHSLTSGGDDNLPVSIGVNGLKGGVNAPTVFNAVFNLAQFWDGRAKNLEEQSLGPIENPVEMAHSLDDLILELKETEYYDEFNKIYSDGITKQNIANAISEFEKTLITPNSRFDRFLIGEINAITDYEKEGYELFKNKGCISCHHGVNVGGNQYNKFGSIVDIKSDNLGRYNLTKDEDDKYYFKVPTLRNIELTAPYFHDGRFYDLKETVKTMSLVQSGRPISEDEIDKIVAFLKTLTGKVNIIK